MFAPPSRPLAKETAMAVTETPSSLLRLLTLRNGARAIPGDRVRAAAAVRHAGIFAGSAGSRRPRIRLRADPPQAVPQDPIHCPVCAEVFRRLPNTHLRSPALLAHDYKRRLLDKHRRPL